MQKRRPWSSLLQRLIRYLAAQLLIITPPSLKVGTDQASSKILTRWILVQHRVIKFPKILLPWKLMTFENSLRTSLRLKRIYHRVPYRPYPQSNSLPEWVYRWASSIYRLFRDMTNRITPSIHSRRTPSETFINIWIIMALLICLRQWQESRVR